MTERKLATIRVIDDVIDIQNADNIQLAIIDGWSVVVKKNEFKAGDLCVYVEIDSLLPERSEFEFLRSKNFHIKTMKLNKFKVISQGICFSLSILPYNEYKVSDDVTELLGITKYDKDDVLIEKKKQNWWFRFKIVRSLFLRKSRRNEFPDWISKTDEPRIENNIYFLNKKIPYIVTEKLDGCSVTYAMKKIKTWYGHKFEFIVCSRNRRVYENDKQYWVPVYKHDLKKRMKDYLKFYGKNKSTAICIQGELVGPGIQKNKYKLDVLDFFAFNMFLFRWHNYWDFDKFTIEYNEQEIFCENIFGVKRVPLIANNFVLPDTIEELRKLVNRPSALNDKVMTEGGVFRNYENKVSFKCINPEFLVKFGE